MTEETKTLVYAKGTTITFTVGEYSDYNICGQVTAIAELNLPALVREYRAETNPSGGAYGDELYGFVSWLMKRELVVPSDGETVHLGSYGTFEEEFRND